MPIYLQWKQMKVVGSEVEQEGQVHQGREDTLLACQQCLQTSAQGLNLNLRWLRSALMDDGLKSSWRYPLQVDKLET